MIVLSYSTINALINEPHTYLCKVMELETFSNHYMEEGKQAHRVIQDHVSGRAFDSRLKDVHVKFPFVEQVDKDKTMEFYYEIDDKYAIHGFLDGKDPDNRRFLEIKTSGTPWTMKRFEELMQWRVYALANPNYEEVVMITCTRQIEKTKVYTRTITQKDQDEAFLWLQKGIDVIEKGDFSYKGIGRSQYCYYLNCPWCTG